MITHFPIQGTFDIALARNALRQKINQAWGSMPLKVRASTAITALGELIIDLNRPEGSIIKIELNKVDVVYTVQLSCLLRLEGKKPQRWDEYLHNLSLVTSELHLEESTMSVQLEAIILEG